MCVFITKPLHILQISTLADHNEELMKLKHAGPWSKFLYIIQFVSVFCELYHPLTSSLPASLSVQVFRIRMLHFLAIHIAIGKTNFVEDSIHIADDYCNCILTAVV